MSRELAIDPRRTALLLMDFQNDIVAKGGALAPSDDEALRRIAAAMAAAGTAAEAARAAGVLVVHVAVGRRSGEPPANPHMPILQFIANANALVIGSQGQAFHADAQPAEGEPVVVKRGVSAFAGTEMATMLQGRGIDTVVLCGFATHMVVVGTARDAADRGYYVTLVRDGCTSSTQAAHEDALQRMGDGGLIKVRTVDELVGVLGE